MTKEIKELSEIEVLEYILWELKVIQELWFEKNQTYLSSIDNAISLCEIKLKRI